MNDSLTKHVVVLAVLCIAVTGVTFLAVGVEAALCCAILSLVVFVFFLVVSLRRRAEIRRPTDEIDEVLNLGRRLSFSNCREGDVAVLANELEKMVARLSRLTSQIENEKTALADSLADISHQIRTPLTAAELMLPAIERATDEEQRKRLARDLEHLLDRVSWLVATLLKTAKVDAGALHMESRPVSVASMVARACAPLELSLDLRGIALVIEISDDVRFTGDETWCAEAVENIVKNSMEHCQAGGTITIRAEEDALACHISISDDGPRHIRGGPSPPLRTLLPGYRIEGGRGLWRGTRARPLAHLGTRRHAARRERPGRGWRLRRCRLRHRISQNPRLTCTACPAYKAVMCASWQSWAARSYSMQSGNPK